MNAIINVSYAHLCDWLVVESTNITIVDCLKGLPLTSLGIILIDETLIVGFVTLGALRTRIAIVCRKGCRLGFVKEGTGMVLFGPTIVAFTAGKGRE